MPAPAPGTNREGVHQYPTRPDQGEFREGLPAQRPALVRGRCSLLHRPCQRSTQTHDTHRFKDSPNYCTMPGKTAVVSENADGIGLLFALGCVKMLVDMNKYRHFNTSG